MFLVLDCNLQLAIKNIIDISPELSFIKTGDSLFDHINEGSKNKLRLFLDTLQEQRLANDWEIFVQEDDVEFFLIFDGFQKESGIILFAAENQESKGKLRKKWKSKVGLEKSSEVSNAALSKENETRSDIAIFDDISDMYNEMAALQRELAKKQAQLEKSNSIIQRYANELEELIAERTEELRASEEKFRGIFENSSLGIAIVDAQGIPLSCNNAFDEIVGVNSKSPVSTNMILDLTGYKDQEWEFTFTDIVEGNAFSNPKEIERKLSDDRTIWLSVNTYRINQRNDANPLLVIMLEDITRRKMDEQALVHAEKLTAVGRIAASLAHEINNPLQAIIGHLSLARELIYQPEEVTNYLQIASEELARIARIVGDLRQASQKPALKEKKPTDLVHIVNKVLQLVEKKAVNNNIDLELK